MTLIAVHRCEPDLHLRSISLYSFATGLRIVHGIIRMTYGLYAFQVAKAVSHSLNNCVNCLPGQKDVDMALRSIGEASKKLLVDIVSRGHLGIPPFSVFVFTPKHLY